MKQKNNHFVPQFHLRQWSFDKKTIMTYNINKDIYVSKASIKNQASKNYLYGHDEKFENIMGEIETFASPLYNKIISNKNMASLNETELDFIYFYVNLCNERSNSRATEQSYVITEIMKTWLKMSKEHNVPEVKDIPLKTIEDLSLQYENPNYISVANIAQYYGLTYDLACVLLYNKTDYEFLTSDYPTIVYNLYSNKHNLFSGWGMCSGGIIYILPINPKFAIMLYDSIAYDCNVNNTTVEIKHIEDINEINRLTMINSEFCVYGTNNIPHNYLRNLKKKLNVIRYEPIEKFGDEKNEMFIAVHRKRLFYLANFRFLAINKDFDKIPPPTSAAGIIRPKSEEINKQLTQYWQKVENEIKNKKNNQ